MIEASDAVLVAAARHGDLVAFESLVRRHQLAVYRVALRLLGSEADAEDVAQESFVQAWRSLARFRGHSAFATWLYRIVTNRALNTLAARRETVSLDVDVIGALDDPSETLERRERLRAVTDGLLMLDPEERALLVLRELEGLTYAQIAEVLAIAPSTVKGRMHRARVALVTKVGGAW
ncbi:MAG: sigma-70 family RNA polymerase sigma factor [Solirubrobacteraceae bacterium]